MTKTHTKSSLFAIFAMTSILLLSPSMASNAFATNHLTYASGVVQYNEGAGVSDARDDPNAALGPEDSFGVVKFVSLGVGGDITLVFPNPVTGTLSIYEATFGGWPLESVDVLVSSDGINFNSIGTALNGKGVPLSETQLSLSECITHVKIVDTTPVSTGDNFDVDAVGATEECTLLPPLEICEDDTMNLIAGQTIDAGDVTIINDGTKLFVTIETQAGWSLTESHLDFGDLIDGFPTNKKGNPKVGHFDFQESHALGTTEFTYEFLLADLGIDPLAEETIPIAIHTVVVQVEADEITEEESAWKQGDRFVEKGNWAMHSTYDIQDCDEIE